MRIVGIVLIGIAVSVAAMAQVPPNAVGVPEVDPSSGVSALALLSGALLIIRGRRKQ